MRDYFGLINGTIPSCIQDELPFNDMCCNFDGYMPRYEGCGCCVYDLDDNNMYRLYTECRYNGQHNNITRDTSFARWSINRSSIPLLHEKIKYLRMVSNEVDDKPKLTFSLIVMNELLDAFDRYMPIDTITFTSET